MLTVYYSDGREIQYEDAIHASVEIEEIVFGSAFAVTVDSIESDDGVEYGATFSIEVAPQ